MEHGVLCARILPWAQTGHNLNTFLAKSVLLQCSLKLSHSLIPLTPVFLYLHPAFLFHCLPEPFFPFLPSLSLSVSSVAAL